MKRSKEEKSIIFIFAIFFVILFGIAIYGIGKLYGPILVPDEVGYWAHAANLIGYDWKEVMSLHPYYSYGYGILMAPFLYFIENTIILYRVMTVINFLLLFGGMILLYRIIIKILPDIERKLVAILCGGTMLYSSHIVYAQTTMPEVLLIFLFLLITLALICYLEKFTYIRMFISIIVMTYMYVVHMRTIGVVISGILILALPLIMDKKNLGRLLVLLGIVALIAILVTAYKSGYLDAIGVMNKEGIDAANDYKGQINKLKYILSIKGLWAFVAGLLGKLFYLGSATFGIFFWGIGKVVCILCNAIKRYKEDKCVNTGFISAFLLLVLISTLSISTIFNISTTRLDAVMYGRYNEHVLSVFMLLGFVQILNSKNLKKGTWLIVCIQSVCCIAVNQVIELNAVEGMRNHSVVGVAYVLEFAKDRLYNITFLIHMCGCVLVVMIAIVAFYAQKKKQLWLLGSIFLVLQLVIGFYSCNNLVYSTNRSNYSDVVVADDIHNMANTGRNVIYLYSIGWGRMDLLQYCLQDIPLHVIEQEIPDISVLSENDIVVVAGKGTAFDTPLSSQYTDYMESNHYSIYYNSYDGE